MARRLPGIRQRMEEVALELYATQGVAATTVRQIADAAGTTERTFFRHFRDKIDVAFGDEQRLLELAVQATREAEPGLSPLSAATAGLLAVAAEFDERRSVIARRAEVVAREPILLEREYGRTSAWVAVMDTALCARGVDPATARLVAMVAMSTFRVAFERWARDADTMTDLRSHVEQTTADLRMQLRDAR